MVVDISDVWTEEAKDASNATAPSADAIETTEVMGQQKLTVGSASERDHVAEQGAERRRIGF